MGPRNSCVVVTPWAICIACDISIMNLLQQVRQDSDLSASWVSHGAGLGHSGTAVIKQWEWKRVLPLLSSALVVV